MCLDDGEGVLAGGRTWCRGRCQGSCTSLGSHHRTVRCIKSRFFLEFSSPLTPRPSVSKPSELIQQPNPSIMSENTPPSNRSTSGRPHVPRQPSMFQSTMVLPMVDPNTPPYRYPGSGPGESELWRIRENPETPLFTWPPPPRAPPRAPSSKFSPLPHIYNCH